MGLRQRLLRLHAVRLVDDCLREQLLAVVGIKLDPLGAVDGEAAGPERRRLVRLVQLQLLDHLLLLRQQLGAQRLLELRSDLRLSTAAIGKFRTLIRFHVSLNVDGVAYLSGACRTGVFCSDRLVDEHIDADKLALSQCCTSELRRASSIAISVSLLES